MALLQPYHLVRPRLIGGAIGRLDHDAVRSMFVATYQVLIAKAFKHTIVGASLRRESIVPCSHSHAVRAACAQWNHVYPDLAATPALTVAALGIVTLMLDIVCSRRQCGLRTIRSDAGLS